MAAIGKRSGYFACLTCNLPICEHIKVEHDLVNALDEESENTGSGRSRRVAREGDAL